MLKFNFGGNNIFDLTGNSFNINGNDLDLVMNLLQLGLFTSTLFGLGVNGSYKILSLLLLW